MAWDSTVQHTSISIRPYFLQVLNIILDHFRVYYYMLWIIIEILQRGSQDGVETCVEVLNIGLTWLKDLMQYIMITHFANQNTLILLLVCLFVKIAYFIIYGKHQTCADLHDNFLTNNLQKNATCTLNNMQNNV